MTYFSRYKCFIFAPSLLICYLSYFKVTYTSLYALTNTASINRYFYFIKRG